MSELPDKATNVEIITLFNGYSTPAEIGMKANCTCTLLKGLRAKVIIDTRTSWDGEAMLKALQKYNISPNDIQFCICTHAHSDHIGCNYLFKNCLQFVGCNCISERDHYYEHDFKYPYIIENKIKIIATPGHTSEDISVLVEADQGLVAIVGDLIEKEEDLSNDTLWKQCSEFPDLQLKSREKILQIADYIIPGHGPMFKNPHKHSN